jgi:gamma-glutamylcyclotransferase (GGCT)/AIG2-like uncharacterized protein YtfP
MDVVCGVEGPGFDHVKNDGQLLFVYGSLLNSAKRVLLLGRSINASPARLPGYARGRKRFDFVAKQADAITDGAILEGLTARDLTILDEYEEVPRLYTRERVEVLAADARKIECWFYLPTSWAKD